MPKPYDDSPRETIGIAKGDVDNAIVAAAGAWFVIEVMHGLLRWVVEPGPSLVART